MPNNQVDEVQLSAERLTAEDPAAAARILALLTATRSAGAFLTGTDSAAALRFAAVTPSLWKDTLGNPNLPGDAVDVLLAAGPLLTYEHRALPILLANPACSDDVIRAVVWPHLQQTQFQPGFQIWNDLAVILDRGTVDWSTVVSTFPAVDPAGHPHSAPPVNGLPGAVFAALQAVTNSDVIDDALSWASERSEVLQRTVIAAVLSNPNTAEPVLLDLLTRVLETRSLNPSRDPALAGVGARVTATITQLAPQISRAAFFAGIPLATSPLNLTGFTRREFKKALRRNRRRHGQLNVSAPHVVTTAEQYDRIVRETVRAGWFPLTHMRLAAVPMLVPILRQASHVYDDARYTRDAERVLGSRSQWMHVDKDSATSRDQRALMALTTKSRAHARRLLKDGDPAVTRWVYLSPAAAALTKTGQPLMPPMDAPPDHVAASLWAAGSPILQTRSWDSLAADPAVTVRAAAAAHPAVPVDVLRGLAADASVDVRAAAASNSGILAAGQPTWEPLARDRYDVAKAFMAVAAVDATPLPLFEPLVAVLAAHPAVPIRRAVAALPRTPVEVLEQLLDDPDPAIQANVQSQIVNAAA